MIITKEGLPFKVEPLFKDMDIVVAMDTSKSNTGIIVGNQVGDVYADFEINGSAKTSGTSEQDMIALCRESRFALKEIFSGANVQDFIVEDIITTKDKVQQGTRYYISKGMDHHESRFKITMMFNSMIFLFDDFFGIHEPILVNNNTWKSNVVPEQYRHGSEKYSQQWLLSIGHPYGLRSNDICDAYCIYLYYVTCCKHRQTSLSRITDSGVSIRYALTPNRLSVANCSMVEYNSTITFMENIQQLNNKSKFGKFTLAVNIQEIPYEIIKTAKLLDQYSLEDIVYITLM